METLENLINVYKLVLMIGKVKKKAQIIITLIIN